MSKKEVTIEDAEPQVSEHEEFAESALMSLTKTQLLNLIVTLKNDNDEIKRGLAKETKRIYPDHYEHLKKIGMKPEDVPVTGQVYGFLEEPGSKYLKPLRKKHTKQQPKGQGTPTSHPELIKITQVSMPPEVTTRETARGNKYCSVSFMHNSLNADEAGDFPADAPVSTITIDAFNEMLKKGMVRYDIEKPKATVAKIPLEK